MNGGGELNSKRAYDLISTWALVCFRGFSVRSVKPYRRGFFEGSGDAKEQNEVVEVDRDRAVC